MKYKDPITGEYKTIHMKTSDTLPVGTIVSFEGDEIPEGYEEVIGEEARVVISPTEPTTGEEVWIDNVNKKIYTKNENDTYIELSQEKVIFDGILKGGETLNADFTKYKRLYITCRVFDGNNDTAGVSNVIVMDLTKNGEKTKWYTASGVFLWLSNNFETIQEVKMGVFCMIDNNKTSFKSLFEFNGSFQNDNSNYCVQKIVGVL